MSQSWPWSHCESGCGHFEGCPNAGQEYRDNRVKFNNSNRRKGHDIVNVYQAKLLNIVTFAVETNAARATKYSNVILPFLLVYSTFSHFVVHVLYTYKYMHINIQQVHQHTAHAHSYVTLASKNH